MIYNNIQNIIIKLQQDIFNSSNPTEAWSFSWKQLKEYYFTYVHWTKGKITKSSKKKEDNIKPKNKD